MAKKAGVGSGGWVSIPEKFRTSFPSDMFEQKSRGGYRISDSYLKPYQGKRFGITNPYSALNIKINGAQKNYLKTVQRPGDTKGLSFSWFRKHLIGVIEKIEVNALSYTVILSLRSQKIFQDSFKYKKFYSNGGDGWPDLDEKTIKKRKKRHTWPGAGGILREYGDMFKSIKIGRGKQGRFVGVVYTDPKDYKHSSTKKRSSFCYAGLHNEGGRIRGGHVLPKRQFIGHSTYLFDFALKQADRYLFFNVFD